MIPVGKPTMPDGLTDAAKAEIAEAIRIVREDKFEKYVRERTPNTPKEEPKEEPKDEIIVPDPPKATPPPPKDPKDSDPKVDPTGENAPKRSAYWGEILD